MGLLELGLALLICSASLVASGVPVAAWARTRDYRFLLVAGANLALLALGTIWAWGAATGTTSDVAMVSMPTLLLVAVASLLLLGTGLARRHG